MDGSTMGQYLVGLEVYSPTNYLHFLPNRVAGPSLGNAYGMVNYERAVATTKKALFKELFGLLPPKPVILDVGIGFLAGVGCAWGMEHANNRHTYILLIYTYSEIYKYIYIYGS